MFSFFYLFKESRERLLLNSITSKYIMKKISFLLLALVVLFTACGDDRNEGAALRLDGDNLSAPLLTADTYEAAARFSAAETGQFVGQNLTEVSYFIAGTPQQTTLIIYSGGTNEPEQVVYEASLTGTITQNSFNNHVLAEPLAITGEPLWISIKIRQNRTLQTIGCDAGPTSIGGDWLFQESDGQWLTFGQRNGESINWNIRGFVAE